MRKIKKPSDLKKYVTELFWEFDEEYCKCTEGDEVIENCDNLTEQEILEREQYWMNYFDSQNLDKGYNLLDADETPLEHFSIGSKNVKARLNEEKVLDIS